MSELLTRPYCKEDIPSLIAIENQVQFSPWTESMFEHPLALDRYSGRVLCQQDEIIGFYLVEQVLDQATLHNIAIAPARQGKGYGRFLLNDAVIMVKTQKAAEMLLEVRESNSSARSLYLAQGFQQVGERKGYYAAPWGRENGLVMSIKFNKNNELA